MIQGGKTPWGQIIFYSVFLWKNQIFPKILFQGGPPRPKKRNLKKFVFFPKKLKLFQKNFFFPHLLWVNVSVFWQPHLKTWFEPKKKQLGFFNWAFNLGLLEPIKKTVNLYFL